MGLHLDSYEYPQFSFMAMDIYESIMELDP